MKLLNFNIIKLTIALVIGILLGYYFEFPLDQLLISFSVLIGILIASFFLTQKQKAVSIFGIITLIIFILIGTIRTELYDETLQKNHYSKSISDSENYHDIQIKISERLKPDNYNYKYFAEVVSLNGSKTSGKVLLNISKDSLQTELMIGDVLFCNAQLNTVSGPKNPFQFDYKTYLKDRNVNHQLYLNHNEYLTLKTENSSFNSYADHFRLTANTKLEQAEFSTESLSIINALLLGQRQHIDEETRSNYINAGVIHILAVSGLHVGIIYLILGFILRPLHRLKHGKFIIKPILILLGLWTFAIIAGLSPSVTRATTMFSIVALAGFYKRPTNIYNTLIISAFLLLLIKPFYLFDVGFQLSYVAVFAIVSIQPMIYKLWNAPNKILDIFWQTFTVTSAAQIGVAPLSIFYFHQFPGLFFLSNLVIIPFLGIILGFGILVITLAYFDLLPKAMAATFDTIILALNDFIAWVAQFENFLIKDISLNFYLLVAFYLVLISLIYVSKTKSGRAIQYSLISLIFLSMVLIFTKQKNTTSELVIFNKNRHTLIGIKKNRSVKFHHNLDSESITQDKTINNYKVGNFISESRHDTINSVYDLDNKNLLVIDSLGIYNVETFRANYILLTNSPKVNLNRLIDSIKPLEIIADASNYKSYVERWKLTCLNKKIPFHSTYEKGAYIISSGLSSN